MARESLFKVLWGQKRGMTLLIAFLMLANLSVYLLQSQYLEKKLTGLRIEVLDRQQTLRMLQQQKNSGSMPVSTMNKVESELKRFQDLVPPEKGLSVFIGDLYKYASSSKLDIKQISYRPEWDESLELLRYGLNFTVSGSYSQLKRFVHLLEGADRIIIINDLSLSAGETRKEQPSVVTLRINLMTYFRENG